MFRTQLLVATIVALMLDGVLARAGVPVGNGAAAPARPSFAADKGGGRCELATTDLPKVHTYRVRLVAYYLGSFVQSCEVTFTAANDLQFRNAVGNAQAVFARSLNARHKQWNRISYSLVSVD